MVFSVNCFMQHYNLQSFWRVHKEVNFGSLQMQMTNKEREVQVREVNTYLLLQNLDRELEMCQCICIPTLLLWRATLDVRTCVCVCVCVGVAGESGRHK
jgi:hypothetical protein